MGILYTLNGICDDIGPMGQLVSTRIGDAIYLDKFNLRGWLSNKADRLNMMYRIIAFKYCDPNYAPKSMSFVLAPNGNRIIEDPE